MKRSGRLPTFEKNSKTHLTFSGFNFEPALQDGINAMGFDTPTLIQEQAIPVILNNRDLIACAQTGYRQNCSIYFARPE